jgi:hypothetical protein
VLIEQIGVKQTQGEARKRWFASSYFDLIVWQEDEGSIAAFQLCYEREGNEKALEWREPKGLSSYVVDEGEGPEKKLKASPVLIPGGTIDLSGLIERFVLEAKGIDKGVSSFVLAKLWKFQRERSK